MLGGLVLYQEANFVGTFNLVMMGVGILLISCGCGLVGRRKTVPKRFMPGHVVAHHVRSRVKARRHGANHVQLAEVTPRNARAAMGIDASVGVQQVQCSWS